jgi:hypothetical protein
VAGRKDIENPTWSASHRAPILIHAAKTVCREAVECYRAAAEHAGLEFSNRLHTGAIVGMVTVVDCVPEHPSAWFEGPIGWLLADAVEFDEPIPAGDALGLWEFDGLNYNEIVGQRERRTPFDALPHPRYDGAAPDHRPCDGWRCFERVSSTMRTRTC